MPEPTKFFDYAPVTRSRGTSSQDAEGFTIRKSEAAASETESTFDRGTAEPRKKDRGDGATSLSESVGARVGARRREHWMLKRGHAVSFIGLFLFTFLVFFRPYELSPSLFWLSKSAFWVAVATLIVFVPTQLGLENKITARPREVNLVLLLLLTGLMSIPFALDRLRAWNSFTEYLKVVLMFIVLVNVVRTEWRLKAIIILVLVASCLLSGAALNDYRLGRLALRGDRIEGTIGGLFDNPNDLALHLVTMIPISIGLLLGSSNLLKKLVYLGAAGLLIGGCVVTFSRGGFLGLVCVAIVLAWKLVPRGKMLAGVVSLAIILAFIALVPGAYRSRILTTEDDSAKARTDDLKRSVYLAVRNPIFGVGFDNYALYSNREKATHNSYTQVAAEMGLAAAAIYLMFLVTPINRLRRIQRVQPTTKSSRRSHYLAIALQASLLGFMVSSFFASVAYLWYAYYLVGYSVCLGRIAAPVGPTVLQDKRPNNSATNQNSKHFSNSLTSVEAQSNEEENT